MESLLDLFSRKLDEGIIEKLKDSIRKAKEILDSSKATGPGSIYVKSKPVLEYVFKDDQLVNNVITSIREETSNFTVLQRALSSSISELTTLASANNEQAVQTVLTRSGLNKSLEEISKLKFMRNVKTTLKDGEVEVDAQGGVTNEKGQRVNVRSNSKVTARVIVGRVFLGKWLGDFFATNEKIDQRKDDRNLSKLQEKMGVQLDELRTALQGNIKVSASISDLLSKILIAAGNASKKLKTIKLDGETKETAKNHLAMVKSLGLFSSDMVRNNANFIIGIQSKLKG